MRDFDKFTDNLRFIIKERGITQKQMAKMADMTQSTVSLLLNRYHRPSLYAALVIADALNVKITELTEGKE